MVIIDNLVTLEWLLKTIFPENSFCQWLLLPLILAFRFGRTCQALLAVPTGASVVARFFSETVYALLAVLS